MTEVRPSTNVLRHRDFRLLWLGQAASMLGDQLVIVTLGLFIVQETGSAADLGVVLAAYTVPMVAFLLIGGVWADRLARHRVMIATDLARAVLHTLLAVLILTGSVEIWQMVIIGALFGSAEAFFRPAYSGLLPQTVPEAEIQQAGALSTLARNVTEMAGPALAAGLVVTVGAGVAFAIDAATFLVSAAFLAGVRPRPRGEAVEATGAWTELREGWDAVRSRAWLWAIVAAFSFSLLVCLAPWFVLGPLVAREQYGEAATFGIVAAALGAGTILGALLGLRWRPRHPMRTGLLFALGWPGATVVFAAGAPLGLAVAACVVGGAGIALFDVWWGAALAQRVPGHLLSRVSSFDWMGSLALLPIGFLLAGPAADALGATEVLLGGATLAAIAIALPLFNGETRNLERVGAGGVSGLSV